jgi:hypothetical protein
MPLFTVWLVVAWALWLHYKLIRENNDLPQRTFVGSLMWPFYLLIWLWIEIFATLKSIFKAIDHSDQNNLHD